jgi:CheY-like chemotaxis protein
MSGLDVVRRLRAEPSCKDALIIAITGHTKESIRTEALAAGCDDVLLKPVDLDELRALLDRQAR